MSQNLQNFVKFQKFQFENLVDFEKCCKTHIFLQKSEPIQPKTSNILPKFCQPTRPIGEGRSDLPGLPAGGAAAAGSAGAADTSAELIDGIDPGGWWCRNGPCKAEAYGDYLFCQNFTLFFRAERALQTLGAGLQFV